MLKKLGLIAVTAGLFTTSLSANDAYAGGQFSLIGEFLYLKPTFDDTYFLIDNSEGTNILDPYVRGKRRNNDFGYEPAYRVTLGYDLCECNAGLAIAYSHLDSTASKSIEGPRLTPSIGQSLFIQEYTDFTGIASSKVKTNYQRFDVLYNQKIFSNCGLDLSVFFGLEVADLRFAQKADYLDGIDLGRVRYSSKTDGIGPQLGFSLAYPLFCNECLLPGMLALNIKGSGSLLVSKTKSHTFNDVLDVVTDVSELYIDVKNQKTKRFVPALHARIGFSYDFDIGCLESVVEIGYEISSYLKGISRTQYPDYYGWNYSHDAYDNFDLQGLYVSGSLKF